MAKFGFVILNYLTWNETIECIESIISQKWAKDVNLYVVENGSSNESLKKLEEYKQKNNNFELIVLSENLGFAKGNNLGIEKARDDGCEYVIVSNSDTFIYEDSEFLNKIERIYNIDKKIALISPKIINKQGLIDVPFAYSPLSLRKKIKWIFFYLTYFYKLYYFIRVYVLFSYITKLAMKKERIKQKEKEEKEEFDALSSYVYASQGAFIILTPVFFSKFDGFFDKTFLFCEEWTIAEMIYQEGFKEYFYTDIKVLHKGSKTIDNINDNYKEKVKFTLKHRLSSCRHYVKMYIRNLLNGK